MKAQLILVIILLSITANAQSNSEEFKIQILESEFLNKSDVKTELISQDFSRIMTKTKNYAVMGFIGDDYQRLQIKLISIIKNNANPSEYFIYGKSLVKGNICEFQGTLNISSAHYYSFTEYPQIKQGLIFGEYTFYENPNQKHVGIFRGNFSTDWYLDANNLVQYNDLMEGADGFDNNKFVGTWTPYNGGKPKPCNWGDYRIPMSGDLDTGAGEFYPDKKYNQNGWQNYVQAYGGQGLSKDAIDREKAEWWK